MSRKAVYISILVPLLVLGVWLIVRETRQNNAPSLNAEESQTSAVQSNKSMQNKQAIVDTSMGKFTVEFFAADAPKAVENFIGLAEAGKYNGSPFHRVIKGFMIQGGDYTKGDGTGGATLRGSAFPDELNASAQSYKDGYKRGVVAMANAGPDTNGSQFFIMHADYALPHSYTIFGKVVEGMDVIDAIANVPVLENSFGEMSVPTQKVIIKEVTVVEKGE